MSSEELRRIAVQARPSSVDSYMNCGAINSAICEAFEREGVECSFVEGRLTEYGRRGMVLSMRLCLSLMIGLSVGNRLLLMGRLVSFRPSVRSVARFFTRLRRRKSCHVLQYCRRVRSCMSGMFGVRTIMYLIFRIDCFGNEC
jgi:hypothetical protein